MAKAYLFGEIEITDQATFEEYRKLVPDTIAAYGGKYLVRGPDSQPKLVEGESEGNLRLVVLEFPSRERLEAWYASSEYKPVREIRFRSAHTKVWLMTGLD
jgi:uncharacterized protein (DUF1330 family)